MKMQLSLVVVFGLCSGFTACTGTRDAYKEAAASERPVVETAFVVTEHYAAVLNEAATLVESGTLSDADKDRIRKADLIIRPYIVGDEEHPGLKQLVELYERIRTPESEAELQKSVDEAILQLSKYMNVIREKRVTQ